MPLRSWIRRWLLAGVLLAGVLLLGGLLLPSGYALERAVKVQAPPAVVHALVADPRRWKDWTAWNRRDMNMALSYSGPASGAGAGWAWQSRSEGSGSMRFTAVEVPTRVAYELRMADWDGVSTGELRLRPLGNGTEVRWTMSGDVGPNPLARWFGLFMDRLVGKDFESGLQGLKQLAEGG